MVLMGSVQALKVSIYFPMALLELDWFTEQKD